MVVMAAVVGFTHLLAGFDNPALARAVTALLPQLLLHPQRSPAAPPAARQQIICYDTYAYQVYGVR